MGCWGCTCLLGALISIVRDRPGMQIYAFVTSDIIRYMSDVTIPKAGGIGATHATAHYTYASLEFSMHRRALSHRHVAPDCSKKLADESIYTIRPAIRPLDNLVTQAKPPQQVVIKHCVDVFSVCHFAGSAGLTDFVGSLTMLSSVVPYALVTRLVHGAESSGACFFGPPGSKLFATQPSTLPRWLCPSFYFS